MKLLASLVALAYASKFDAKYPSKIIAFYSAKQQHYGDPFARPCLSNELNISIQGLSGWICSPSCTNRKCPTDVPSGVYATPKCDINDGQTGGMLCGLVCNTTRDCGYNATCKPIANTALCTYDI